MILDIGDILNSLFGLFGIGILLGFVLVMFLFYVLFLKWGISRVHGKENNFGNAFITALLSYVCGYIPCGCFLSAYIISTRHKVSYGNGILAIILAAIIPLILFIIFIVVFILLTIGFPAFFAMFGF